MTERERQSIHSTIESEGFEYAFVEYSSFDHIKDRAFHEARQAYLDARAALAELIEWED